jgi:hypothetical protein
MSLTLPASTFFSAPHPAALELPHLITTLDAELLGKVAHLTRSFPGIWPVPAPFDDADVLDKTRESAPFANWALIANQAELLSFGQIVREAFFGTKVIIVNALFDESVLARFAPATGERLETGAYVFHNFADSPHLADLLNLCGWALIPIGPERSQALFIVARENALLVAELRNWCERHGRNVGELKAGTGAGQLVIESTPAPEKHRVRVMTQHIDEWLGEMEGYFGPASDDLGAFVQQRVEARRQLREKILQANAASPTD